MTTETHLIDNISIEICGKIDVTPEEMDALESGFFLKKSALNKCPKKGDHIAAYCGTPTDPHNFRWKRCKIWLKEKIGDGPPGTCYRLIIGNWI